MSHDVGVPYPRRAMGCSLQLAEGMGISGYNLSSSIEGLCRVFKAPMASSPTPQKVSRLLCFASSSKFYSVSLVAPWALPQKANPEQPRMPLGLWEELPTEALCCSKYSWTQELIPRLRLRACQGHHRASESAEHHTRQCT